MGDSDTTTAARRQKAHPLSVQERMAIKGWRGPVVGPGGSHEGLQGKPMDDDSSRTFAASAQSTANLSSPPTQPSGRPPEPVDAVPPGWSTNQAGVSVRQPPLLPHAERPPERYPERRVERRRAERHGLGDLIGGDAEVFSLVVSRRDMILMGCCTAVGVVLGYVLF